MQPEPEHPKNLSLAEVSYSGGKRRMELLTDQERSDLGKLAARARWHPREFQAEKDKARRLADLIQQALKDGT
jgi:hypothetical protein